MTFNQWISSNYDPYTDEFTLADMESAFEAGRQLDFNEGQLDRIIERAIESMHQDFLTHNEPDLIKLHPMIPMGYLIHILKAIRKE